jgi:S-adenosyl-L-methionine hydrolase (adenosine-forming)
MNTQPLVALITDYGSRDVYVAELKGAMYSIFPNARIVDISHEVEPFNFRQAAYLLNQASREFPKGTIFVFVIDPGVGTERSPIMVQTKENKFYIGPDNGILTLVLEREGFQKAWHLNQPEYYRKLTVSNTFHGLSPRIWLLASVLIKWERP